MNESKPYMAPQGYVDPTSKYYIDRVWEEYHKMKAERDALREQLTHQSYTLSAEHQRTERILDALREPSEVIGDAAYDAFVKGRFFMPWAIRAAVAAAEQEVGEKNV